MEISKKFQYLGDVNFGFECFPPLSPVGKFNFRVNWPEFARERWLQQRNVFERTWLLQSKHLPHAAVNSLHVSADLQGMMIKFWRKQRSTVKHAFRSSISISIQAFIEVVMSEPSAVQNIFSSSHRTQLIFDFMDSVIISISCRSCNSCAGL